MSQLTSFIRFETERKENGTDMKSEGRRETFKEPASQQYASRHVSKEPQTEGGLSERHLLFLLPYLLDISFS